MGQSINYGLAKDALQKLNTDDTISSAHGLLCGFYCVKQDISLDDWLNEVLVSIDLNNILEKESHQVLAEIFNNTSEQLADPTLNFWVIKPRPEQKMQSLLLSSSLQMLMSLQHCLLKRNARINAPP